MKLVNSGEDPNVKEFRLGMVYLWEIGEPKDNSLRVVVAEAHSLENKTSDPTLSSSVRPIVVTPESRYFELLWKSYVAYSVRNEGFKIGEPDEPLEIFGERTSSSFLRFIAEATLGADTIELILKKPIRHWGLNCLNHSIDVVAVDPPEIRQLSAPDARANGGTE